MVAARHEVAPEMSSSIAPSEASVSRLEQRSRQRGRRPRNRPTWGNRFAQQNRKRQWPRPRRVCSAARQRIASKVSPESPGAAARTADLQALLGRWSRLDQEHGPRAR